MLRGWVLMVCVEDANTRLLLRNALFYLFLPFSFSCSTCPPKFAPFLSLDRLKTLLQCAEWS